MTGVNRKGNYRVKPEVKSALGVIGLQCSSKAFDKRSVAVIVAVATQMPASAKCLPGQTLHHRVSEKSEQLYVDVGYVYVPHRRPKPKTASRGSSTSTDESMNLSGRNSSGWGYARDIALGSISQDQSMALNQEG